MCGIIGYIGTSGKATSILVNGLKALEYRGYDSAGVSIMDGSKRYNVKAKGKVSNLENALNEEKVIGGEVGIAHTRWATHGVPNQINAHPHTQGMVTLVHNGIIENDHELRQDLISKGYTFISETDSEVAAACIDDCLKGSESKIDALRKANHRLKGSFAFGIIFDDESSMLYAMRRNSPLILAIGDDENYIASDVPAIVANTKQYILLDQDEIACIQKDTYQIFDVHGNEVVHDILTAEMEASNIQKDGYDHFMLKEMMEEPKVVFDTIHHYIKAEIDELDDTLPDFSKYNEIHLVSCGSALYAGMIAKSIIEQYARIRVEVEYASEYRYKHPMFTDKTLVLIVSQSGETADSLAALYLAKEHNIDTYAIVNVVGSSIAREARYVSYTYAGPEIAVATTKAYMCQVALLSLVCLKLCNQNGSKTKAELQEHVVELLSLKPILENQLRSSRYFEIAASVYDHDDIFFIGRSKDYAMCLEGSLKLKEISYIHSEAYPAGELKHGTISLIDNETPVFGMCSDESVYEKTLSNLKEVKARGAKVLIFARKDFAIDESLYEVRIDLAHVHPLLQPLVSVIPLQMIAYEIAKLRGCEIDQPRNLAKSVTVE